MAQKILTVPETITEELDYYPVGNEWIALPEVNQFGKVESFNVISEYHKGMLEVRGGADPLLAPYLTVDGEVQELTDLSWTRLEDWIPRFTLGGSGWKLEGTVFCPHGRRGFVYLLSVANNRSHQAEVHFRLGGQLGEHPVHSLQQQKVPGQQSCLVQQVDAYPNL